MKNKKQVALIILDGWGYREETKDNAIASADKPFFDGLWQEYPHTLLNASGLAVGLPEGQMGNSEVGHMTIGAGRPLDQDLVRIEKAIQSGEYKNNQAFLKLFEHVKKYNSTLHVMGLVSDGGVHSHFGSLLSFIETAKGAGIKKLAIHAFLDGRDTPPQSGSGYLKILEDKISELGFGHIASVSGRYYAMDRDSNWDRLAKAESAIFEGKATLCQNKASSCLEAFYEEGKVDELLEPFICPNKDGQIETVNKDDGIFFINFRADRARQLTSKIIAQKEENNFFLVTMASYGNDFNTEVAFPPIEVKTTLAKEISEAGLTQAHIAETEKFAHATYFLNGGMEVRYKGEEDILLPSRKDVATYDLAPKMSAEKIADKAIEQIEKGTDFLFINFANPDMVGHTAVVPAIIEAIEETDKQLGRVIKKLQEKRGIALITADHGNAEINVDPVTGKRHTAHTTNPVPCIMTDKNVSLHQGTLADLAPTVLDLFGIKKPEDMTGNKLSD
jgi:2,3-bisphosphoglycerate-independent phosphoglycerate mutase